MRSMNITFKRTLLFGSVGLTLGMFACAPVDTTSKVVGPAANVQTSTTNTVAPAAPAASPQPSLSQSPVPEPKGTPEAVALPVTLPVLDAFFAEDSFKSDLKAKLDLTDDQVRRLGQVAHEATAKLSDSSGERVSTADATAQAGRSVQNIIGDQKAIQLADFVRDRWKGGAEALGSLPDSSPSKAATPGNSRAGGQQLNAAPADTRIVVNTPAYRMDLFEDGRLVKSYKVAIGYPEFPLPSGLRKATTIIFNPTWTPPDSPWVASMKNVTAGERVEAGSKLNPLGPIKIPIGMPSLIHGGKSPAKLGGFGSHGCVGLTNAQVQDFAKQLGEIGGTPVTDSDIAGYAKNKSRTKEVKLSKPVPVELRYDTIVVEDGKLHIYRDVYDKGTNTQENLRATLDSYGVSLDQLNEKERAQIIDALKQMSRDATGKPTGKGPGRRGDQDPDSATVTRFVKGKKEIVIDVPELQGKGYPAPVNLDTGVSTGKPRSPRKSRAAAGNGQ